MKSLFKVLILISLSCLVDSRLLKTNEIPLSIIVMLRKSIEKNQENEYLGVLGYQQLENNRFQVQMRYQNQLIYNVQFYRRRSLVMVHRINRIDKQDSRMFMLSHGAISMRRPSPQISRRDGTALPSINKAIRQKATQISKVQAQIVQYPRQQNYNQILKNPFDHVINKKQVQNQDQSSGFDDQFDKFSKLVNDRDYLENISEQDAWDFLKENLDEHQKTADYEEVKVSNKIKVNLKNKPIQLFFEFSNSDQGLYQMLEYMNKANELQNSDKIQMMNQVKSMSLKEQFNMFLIKLENDMKNGGGIKMFIKDIEMLFDLLVFNNIERILEYFFQSSELINKEKYVDKNELQKNVDRILDIGRKYLKIDELSKQIANIPFVKQFNAFVDSNTAQRQENIYVQFHLNSKDRDSTQIIEYSVRSHNVSVYIDMQNNQQQDTNRIVNFDFHEVFQKQYKGFSLQAEIDYLKNHKSDIQKIVLKQNKRADLFLSKLFVDYDISKIYEKNLNSDEERDNSSILNSFIYNYDEFDSYVKEYMYERMLTDKTRVRYEVTQKLDNMILPNNPNFEYLVGFASNMKEIIHEGLGIISNDSLFDYIGYQIIHNSLFPFFSFFPL